MLMTADSDDPFPEASLSVTETTVKYSLEVMADLAGVPETTARYFVELGLLSGPEPGVFDDESLRRLRRIEHLCTLCGVNETGAKILVGLLDEVEQLREWVRRP